MDTPYLEQLKLSSERLQGIIPAVNPFATYTMGAETAPPSIQGVPQNYFDPMTGQFMMPDLQLGETTSTDGNIPASYGTYTPAPFGASATNEVIPGLMSNAMTGRQGGNGPNQSQPQDRYIRNPDGSITKYDASDNMYSNFMLSDIDLPLSNMFFGNLLNAPTLPNTIRGLLDGTLGKGDKGDRITGTEGTGTGEVGSTGPTAYSQARAKAVVESQNKGPSGKGRNQQSRDTSNDKKAASTRESFRGRY